MFYPRWKKTVLGDAASYVLGYVLAYLSMALFRQSGITMPEGMQMVIFGVLIFPAFDLLRVIRERVREQRGILTPDRNQIQHRLQRTGMNRTMVPITILFIILSFATFNSWWVISGYKHLTILFIIDIALFTCLQIIITFAISRNELRHNMAKWQMEYGREAWEADTPVETIKQKQQNFGTMGLPKHVILGDELDFIPDGMNAIEREVKRLVDMTISGILMILFSPLYLFSYILIKLDDGGPAIYSQERIGRFGRPFRIHKFRSMRMDAEKFGPALSHGGGEDDPRLTKVGKFLRANHLDELPQLWDVFIGNMAFIGPRPERKFFIDQIMEHDPRYSFLFQIRPGVTSYATLYNGYTDTMEKMLRRLTYDLYYLEHRSWWLDIKILWLTFISIVSGKKF
jgi:lipopolysaccharide/colanic/teichoic acid biosynthesis glycosyltransferase